MIVTNIPIRIVDFGGSILMILFSFLCLNTIRRLKNRDPDNVMWEYLLWICLGMAIFAISRSVGHILKQVILLMGANSLWDAIRPFSGGVNTMMFVVVASVILFFERIWVFYRRVLADKQALQSAHNELIYLNQNLEQLVAARTSELVQSEHKYRRIFEISKDMILVSDADRRIMEVNPAGYQMFGVDSDRQSLNGKGVDSFFARPNAWRRIMGDLNRNGFISSEETDLLVADDETRRVLVSASLNEGALPQDRIFHFLVKDIEQQRLHQEQMAQADKLASIGQFSSGIAHEINNPLGIIQGYTQLLMRNTGHATAPYTDLKIIEKHVKHCKSIVENLLNFSRPSETAKSLVFIEEMVTEQIEFVQHHADMNHIQMTTDFDPDVPPVFIDEKKIRQVLMNLIMNAKHAVGRKGIIHLTTGYNLHTQKAVICIADTGHGIEKKNVHKIFDPFFTTKPPGEGTGLGLSVSYGIVKSHGGDIFVRSTIGKGTKFTVVLPVQSTQKGIVK